MVSNRPEVKQFIERVNATQANYLSALTGGIHLHVITAPSVEVLTLIERALQKKGYLVSDQ